ncbi:MAG: pyridoxal phosphate-dependent aminotransferase [Pseudomonadales bacterium]|jgi:alanine-synthesizing transaminase|nr:pyridoxal phosphate-dependent aminotransferase [Pseudomonadales bacterium]MDP6472887.1 pyridoxal phosphate-dependent aminotransferase [Pseudomonadales bacterium]MDP6826356.1 pyridoxal phosphate-dependent aminotransferase [Pseudomonadales bacterium]MDP6973287.1 pyridoxal phosphate-dependent aminotransferase [Pseudomonadales bacterium]|tara:strand:+ start:1006 stop:2283 length:1278 start_codon:yes stop_codon:yes gene_type:complete
MTSQISSPDDTTPVSDLVPPRVRQITKSNKLEDVCYDIRGPVLKEAHRLEEEGHRIVKLNIGNPAPFGFEAPEEILRDVIHNLPSSQGYSDSKGIYPARKAVMQYYQQIGIKGVDVEDIYIGNGVSELVVMAMQALIEDGDEVLIPAPDFPLWSAAVRLCGGVPVHYLCDEEADWEPDIEDLETKISARTKAMVVINPNNPTGAVYERAVLEKLARIARARDLVVFADEIYDKILYDGAEYIPFATLAEDILVLTLSGLSKSYRVAGFRTGWMVISGAKHRAEDYIDGLDIIASMRLCSNVPTQHAIQTALGGYQSIKEFIQPGGRLYEQRLRAWEMLNEIDGVSCVKPRGALYLFPKLDVARFNITNDEQFALDLLRQEKLLVVHGTGFNWPHPDHFRIVFLPHEDELEAALKKLGHFLDQYRQ